VVAIVPAIAHIQKHFIPLDHTREFQFFLNDHQTKGLSLFRHLKNNCSVWDLNPQLDSIASTAGGFVSMVLRMVMPHHFLDGMCAFGMNEPWPYSLR
jgi:hypothetical protein